MANAVVAIGLARNGLRMASIIDMATLASGDSSTEEEAQELTE